MRTGLRLASYIINLSFITIDLSPTSLAQVMDRRWSEPRKLSVIVPDAGFPDRASLVADSRGNFHAVWTERRSSDGRVYFLYARFDGDLWSDPILIRTNATGSLVGPLSLSIDGRNRLHLVWTEASFEFITGSWPPFAPVMHMSVDADAAYDGTQWPSARVISATAYYSHLEVDPAGTYHLVYSDCYSSSPGVYYARSSDTGQTWTQPVRIDAGGPPDTTPYYSHLRLDNSGGVHVIWEYKKGWQTQAIGYTRSLDGGFSWAAPITLDEVKGDPNEIQYGYPLLAIQRDGVVHAVWAGGGFANVGRRHRYSADRGQSWTGVAQLFGDLHGFIAAEAFVTGSARDIHLFDLLRFPQGVYHCQYNAGWGSPNLIYMNQKDHTEAVGNRILLERLNAAATSRQFLISFTTDGSPTFLYSMHTLLPPISSVSSASYFSGRPVAAGSIVAGFGSDFAPFVGVPSVWPPPFELQGTRVEVVDSEGVKREARIFFVSPEQINYVMPEETALGPARVRVRRPDGLVAASTVEVSNVAPGVYTLNAQGTGVPVGTYVRVAPDNSRTEELLFDLQTGEAIPLDVRTSQGDVRLLLFGTGFRGFRQRVTASVGGVEVPVGSISADGYVPGLDVIEIGPLPASLAGRGLVEVALAADGVSSNVTTIRIQ